MARQHTSTSATMIDDSIQGNGVSEGESKSLQLNNPMSSPQQQHWNGNCPGQLQSSGSTEEHRMQQQDVFPAISPAALSVTSDSPSVYDLFNLHHPDSDDGPDIPSAFPFVVPPQPCSLRSTPSNYSSNNQNLMRLPPRPPTMIQTRQVGFQDDLSTDNSLQIRNNKTRPTRRLSEPSPFPLRHDLCHSDNENISPHSASHESNNMQQIRRPRLSDIHSSGIGKADAEETTPLFSKMQELQRKEDPEYILLTSNYSSAYTLCGFCCSWLVWVAIWILMFASIIHRKDQHALDDAPNAIQEDVASDTPGIATLSDLPIAAAASAADAPPPEEEELWTRWERIYFASSTFWTVGYGDYVVTTRQERLWTCAFMIFSLCFVGVLLGRWGNSVIEAYKAASLAHSTIKRQQQKHIHNTLKGDIDSPVWTSMGASRSLAALTPANVDPQEFLIFPGLPWLFVQTLFVTALSIFCVFGIQYFEQNEENSNEWTAVSTFYFAISTATTVGFGDVVPTTKQGQILCIFFLPLAIGTSLHWMVWLAQRGIQRIQRNMIYRRDLSNLRLDEFYERRLQNLGLVDAATFAALKKEYEQMS